MLILQTEYGVLGNLVKVAGGLMSAALALSLGWKGRANWEPSEDDVPKGPQRVGSLLSAVAIAIIWATLSDASHVSLLTRMAIGSAMAALLGLLTYAFLISLQTYSAPDTKPGVTRKVIGGFRLTPWARKATNRKTEPKTIQEVFKEAGFDPDKIWTRISRAVAKLSFVICYLALTVCGTLALTCATIVLIVTTTPSDAASIPTDKKVIHIALILNGDVHYTRDIMEGFRSTVEQLLLPTHYSAHFEHVIGFARQSESDQNLAAIQTLFKRFPVPPDYLVPIGTEVSEVVYRTYANKVPLIFVGVTDPVASGIVKNLRADPNRDNLCGVVYGVPTEEYLRFFSLAFPGKSFGFVYDPQYHQDVILRDHILFYAAKLSPPMKVIAIEVDKPELPPLEQSKADIFFGKYLVSTNLQSFIESSTKPFVGSNLMNVQKGAIAAIGSDDKEIGAMAAKSVLYQNLVKGQALRDIPIVVPDHPVVAVNLTAARKYGITISPQVVQQAQLRID